MAEMRNSEMPTSNITINANIDSNIKKVKYVQNYPGKIKILFGKLWLGNPRDLLSVSFTFFLFLAQAIYFVALIGSYFETRFQTRTIKYIPIPFYGLILYNMLKCFFTEPGVIPRGNLENPAPANVLPNPSDYNVSHEANEE